MGKFFELSVYNTFRRETTKIKMEAGVTFENQNFSYTMSKDGKVSIFDKNTKKTTTGKQIELSEYQFKTLQAVANNNDETKDGNLALSADDIQTAINQYENGKGVDTLKEDLSEFYSRTNYKVDNPKAFEEENKFSAYINNGNKKYSSVMAFKFEKEYFDAKIRNATTNEVIHIKMEKGVSFENNGAIYRMNNDGLLAVFDKKTGEWKAGIKEIQMTQYQLDTFNAVANNTLERSNGKKIKEPVYSKGDIIEALKLYGKRMLQNDLSEFLNTKFYKASNTRAYSNNTAFSTLISNQKGLRNAELIFKFGSAQDALDISDFVHNNDLPNDIEPVKPKETKTVKNNHLIEEPSKKIYIGKRFDAKKLKPSQNALNLIKKREALVLYTYDDLDKSNPRKFIKKGMKYKGTLTIGYGHTKGVKPGQQISKEKAEKLLAKDIEKTVKKVKKMIKVPVTQNQFDALVSFAFNVGTSALEKSDLLKYINSGNFERASREFPRWKYSKGKICGGLISRRKDERALFDKSA